MTMLKKIISAICIFGVALSIASAGGAQSTTPAGADALQGTWAAVAVAGRDLPPGMHAAIVFTGTKYQGFENGVANESGTITLDLTKRPIALDLTIAEGRDAGKTQLGILEVAGDTMSMVLAEPGITVRPAALTGEVLTLARITPLPKNLEGSWEGTLAAAGTQMRLAINLANGANGLATGKLISIDQGNREAPIAAVVVRGARVTLVMPAVRGGFDAKLENGELTGTWTQPGGSVPLSLKRKP
jgi:uncharacterized protein (TIGR03067 family)